MLIFDIIPFEQMCEHQAIHLERTLHFQKLAKYPRLHLYILIVLISVSAFTFYDLK